MADLGIERGYVVTGGTECGHIGGNVELVPWHEVLSGAEDFGLRRAASISSGSRRPRARRTAPRG
jgi:hypothetical protein